MRWIRDGSPGSRVKAHLDTPVTRAVDVPFGRRRPRQAVLGDDVVDGAAARVKVSAAAEGDGAHQRTGGRQVEDAASKSCAGWTQRQLATGVCRSASVPAESAFSFRLPTAAAAMRSQGACAIGTSFGHHPGLTLRPTPLRGSAIAKHSSIINSREKTKSKNKKSERRLGRQKGEEARGGGGGEKFNQ